jgi:hypothetical protein
MNPKIILGLALVLGCARTNCLGATDTVQAQFEQMAKTYGHFSLTVVIQNRPLRLGTPLEATKRGNNPLALEQLQLAQELRALSGDRKALAALLENPDPKVRTLALGAIFQREDGRDLALIATLINDPAPTFPNLHESMSSIGGARPMSELEDPQSVGHVAQAMLAFWGVTHNGRPVGMGPGNLEGIYITTDDFAEYWKKYAVREYSASWFAVRMKRATRRTIPIQPEYQPDIQRVLAEMKALPLPDGAWIQLYVLAPEGWFEFEPSDLVARDDELVAMTKKLSPASLLCFLQRQKISDDPDLLMGKQNSEFVRMSNFVLRHADQLLQAEDADTLLACENVERDASGVNPAWSIGAALLQPARADKILRDALARETRTFELAAGELAGALWRIRGPAEMDFLVNWFYTVLPTPSEPVHQPVVLLWGVEAAARPDTKQVIRALVKDARFDSTDWESLKEMLKIVNAGRSTPLVSERDIYAAQPNGLLDERMVLPAWRNLFRCEYGLPEKPPQSPEAKPKQILTRPAYSVPLAKPPSQIVLSPDGSWLAMLANGTITIWQAATGEFRCQITRDLMAGAHCVAFQNDPQRLTVFDNALYGQFSEWNVTTRQPVGSVLLTGKPRSGMDEGAYGFDRAALRMAFSSYNDLACFDTRSGKALWLHECEGIGRHDIALSQNGTRLAASAGAENPRVVRLYDAASGDLLRQFDRHASAVLALALSSDGRKLVTASTAGAVQLWDAATGELLKTYAYQVPSWGMSAPVLSPDSQWLAVVGAEARIGASRVGVFRVDSGDLEWEIQLKTDASIGPGFPLAFAPDGTFLYTGARRLEAWPLK